MYNFRYLVQDTLSGSLITQTVKEFVRGVGARTATPGGGSVSAAVSAMVGSWDAIGKHDTALLSAS